MTTTVRYEVETELNPRYADTGYATDYYGLYHVVKYTGDKREIVRTYSGEWINGRSEAYKLAGKLNTQPPATSDAP